MRRLLCAVAAVAAMSPFIALASAGAPAGAAVTHPAAAATPAQIGPHTICFHTDTSVCVWAQPSGDSPLVECCHANFTDYGQDFSMTYKGETYYSLNQDGTDLCLQWDKDSSESVVIEVACDGNTVSQFFWWSGIRFRNLYATKEGDAACLNGADSYLTLGACSGSSTEWNY
jgi:hypothetical protein